MKETVVCDIEKCNPFIRNGRDREDNKQQHGDNVIQSDPI